MRLIPTALSLSLQKKGLIPLALGLGWSIPTLNLLGIIGFGLAMAFWVLLMDETAMREIEAKRADSLADQLWQLERKVLQFNERPPEKNVTP